MGATQHTTWKPPFPVTDPTQAKYWQSISQWLRVPWVKTWQLTYSGSEASGSAVDIPSASTTMTFKKLRDETRLNFIIHGSFYCTTPNAVCYVYVRLNGTNYGAGSQFVNVGSAHIPVLGAVDIDSIPAGTYTFTLRWARGLNTITVNSDDNWQVRLTETNANPDT